MVQFFSLGPRTRAVTFCRFGKASRINVPIFHFVIVLFFLLLGTRGCRRSHFTDDQTLISVLLWERWCSVAVESKSIKTQFQLLGDVSADSANPEQKHLRSVCARSGQGHMWPHSLRSVNTNFSVHKRCIRFSVKQKHVLSFTYLQIPLRTHCKSTTIPLKPLWFGERKRIHGHIRKILDHKFSSKCSSIPREISLLCAHICFTSAYIGKRNNVQSQCVYNMSAVYDL